MSQEPPQGQRLFDRVEASWALRLTWEGGASSGRVLDLSPTGAFAQVEAPPPLDVRCELWVDGGEAGALEVTARVVRVAESGVGLEFVEMPLEAIGVLQRLLLG